MIWSRVRGSPPPRILVLAVLDRSALHAEAAGRCWSRGRLLAWSADS